MKARDIMTSPAYTIRDTASVGEAARVMKEHRISSLPVVDSQDKLVGIITHSDFFLQPLRYPGVEGHLFELLGSVVGLQNLEKVAKDLGARPVRDVMSQPVEALKEDAELADVVRLMLHDKRKRLPVVRDGKVVGIVCRHDFLKLISPD